MTKKFHKSNHTVRSKPWPTWPTYTTEDERAVIRVIRSNQLFAANEVASFEKEYSQYVGSNYAKALGNATQGLHLALAALDIGINDEIIVTGYSWISSASCVLMQNATPVFVDCECETYGLDPDKIKTAISQNTKAIILVHMFGYPAKVEEVLKIAKDNKISLIEDASHAHGASVNGKFCGTFGDIGVFSLHQRKSLPAGDGGIIVTNSDNINQKIYRLRSFGDESLSYNYRMTEFTAAIARTRLQYLDQQNLIRIHNAEYLQSLLIDTDYINVKKPRTCAKGVYYSVCIEYSGWRVGVGLANFLEYLLTQGVPFRKTWQPIHKHPHFNPKSIPPRGIPWNSFKSEKEQICIKRMKDIKLPNIENLCENVVIELDVHPPVNFKDIEDAVLALKRALRYFNI